MRLATVIGALAFAATTAAVELGGFASLDQLAIDHAMPWVGPVQHAQSLLSGALAFTSHTPLSEIPAELWLYPASVPVTALVTAWCCLHLWWRGLRLSALAWASAWVVGNAIEVIGKAMVDRPRPHLGTVDLPAFDDSFPSGHATRAILLAVLLVTIRPRLRRLAAAWLAVALPLLVVTNAHLPSDVIGAMFLGGGLSLACTLVSRGNAPRLSAVTGVDRQ